MFRYVSKDYSDNGNDNDDSIQKRKSRFFLTISSLRLELFPTCTLEWPRSNRARITRNASSSYHVQHVMCHLVRRDSSAVKFDRVEIVFILVLSYWLNHQAMKEGRKPEYPEKTTSLRKCYILQPEDSSPKRDSNPHSSIGGRLGKQTC